MDYSEVYDHQVEYTPQLSSKKGTISLHSFLFVSLVILLVTLGLITMYSASYDEALRIGRDGAYFFTRQLIFALLGGLSFFIISRLSLSFIKKLVTPLLIISIIFMLLTLCTPLGIERAGARRWLQLGPLPSFQPSELLKIAVVLFIAKILSSPSSLKKSLTISVLLIAISFFLIVVQKDYSTALVFVSVSMLVTIAGGLSLLVCISLALLFSIPATVFLLIEPYRIRRVVSFIFPSIDPSGINYQVSKSLEAIKSGGLFGKGLGQGVYKLGIIPEVHSDFIFASFAEEMGLVGIILLFLLFIAFTYTGIKVALNMKESNSFASLSCFGITMMITTQALINIMVVTSLLPPTGIPLPFFSQGGTNLFVIISECALIYLCMKEERKEEPSW